MENKFNTPKEERAYQLGRLDGMLYYQAHIIKNMKNEYEKLYQKRLDFQKSEGK